MSATLHETRMGCLQGWGAKPLRAPPVAPWPLHRGRKFYDVALRGLQPPFAIYPFSHHKQPASERPPARPGARPLARQPLL